MERGPPKGRRGEARSDIEPDELTWIDSVPVRPARGKRVTIGEYEWVRAAPSGGEPAQFRARFWINNTELVAVLVEETTTRAARGSTDQTLGPCQPRVRMRGRTYLLFVEASA